MAKPPVSVSATSTKQKSVKRASLTATEIHRVAAVCVTSSTPMMSVPVITGDRVYWAWTEGVVALSGLESRELFRCKYGYQPGELAPLGYGVVTVLVASQSVIVMGTSVVQGALELRWHDQDTGGVKLWVRCAEVSRVCLLGDKLFVFTEVVPEPESVTEGVSRVAELGHEGALEAYRSELRWKRQIYTDPQFACVFGNGAVLCFDAATGEQLESVRFARDGEKIWEVYPFGELVVIALVSPEDPYSSNAMKVCRADGSEVWRAAGTVLAVSFDGILLRIGDDVRLLAPDQSERWTFCRPTEIPDAKLVAMRDPVLAFLDPHTGEKNRTLEVYALGTGLPLWSSPVGKFADIPSVSGNRAWVLDAQSKLSALSLESGEVLARVSGRDMRACVSTPTIVAITNKSRGYELAVYSLRND